jgi:5,10-methenyltetrahydromethanopterin hydrogenase
MKLFRLAFFQYIILFAIASLIGALLPGNVLGVKGVNITAPKDSIIPHIKDIEQWKGWMDGMQEASVKITSPTHADLAGTIVDITSVTDSTIVSSWKTKSGNMQTSTVRVIGDSTQKITVVQWQFEQKLKWYPWERLGSMMNDKILGTMMEKNLNNLKALVEKNKSV